DLVILKRQRLQPARELNPPLLPPQHREHRLDVITRTSKQIVVENIPAVDHRQQTRNRIALPPAAKPTFARTAARGEHVTRLDVTPRNKLVAAIAVGNSANLDLRHIPPRLRQ